MRFCKINRNSLGIIAVRVIAVAIFMIAAPLLDRPAVADQSAAAAVVPQQPLDDAVEDFADRIALDQRLQTLEHQIQSLLNMQSEILLNTRKHAVQTRTETFPKSWVSAKQTTTKYRYRRRHEIDGTALAGETVGPNLAAQRG